MDFNPRLVSSVALESLGVPTILGLHHNAVPAVVGKNSDKRAGLMVVGSGRQKKVANKLVGVLNPDFASALQAYGIAISRQEMQEAPSHSGGHPNCRAAVDILQSQYIECCVQRILTAVKLGEECHIVDIGAKFRKISKLLRDRIRASFDDLYPLVVVAEPLRAAYKAVRERAEAVFSLRREQVPWGLAGATMVLDDVQQASVMINGVPRLWA